jgi:hypothetical protein
MFRSGDDGSVEAEREALYRQRAEGAAELARLKQILAERVEFVRMRERELEDALARLGRDGAPAGTRKPLFRLPEGRRDDPALDQQRQVLEARTAELVRREAALREREAELVARKAEVEALAEEAAAAKAAAKPAPPLTKTQREKALDEREAVLAEREAAIAADDSAQRLERMEVRLAELKEAELAFVRTQAELAARSDRLAEREQELAARERELGRLNGGVPAVDPADRVSVVDVESIEARLRRLESGRGQSFSAGVRSLQRRGVRGLREPDAPLH